MRCAVIFIPDNHLVLVHIVHDQIYCMDQQMSACSSLTIFHFWCFIHFSVH